MVVCYVMIYIMAANLPRLVFRLRAPLMCDEPDDFRTSASVCSPLISFIMSNAPLLAGNGIEPGTGGPTSANGAVVSRRLRRIAANPTNTSLKIALVAGAELGC